MASTHPTPTTAKNLPTFWCCTKYDDKELRFTWTIHNFSLRQGGEIQSPVFTSNNGLEWQISIWPTGRKRPQGYVSVSLFFLPAASDSITCPEAEVQFVFTILDAQQEPIHNLCIENEVVQYKFTRSRSGCTLHKFVPRDDLIEFLKDDPLVICFELTICGKRIDNTGWSNWSSRQYIFPVPECTLSDDLESLFKDQNSGDTVIEADGKELFVYKGILQARSSVFTAMFQHEMEEHKKNKVIITDFKPEVVEEMLTYIYTGKSPNLQVMAYDLLSIADKYDLERLKMMSAGVLAQKLRNENAIEILILADLYGVNDLKKFVINFISNNSVYFLDNQVWKNIVMSLFARHSNLVVEVTGALLSSNKNVPQDIYDTHSNNKSTCPINDDDDDDENDSNKHNDNDNNADDDNNDDDNNDNDNNDVDNNDVDNHDDDGNDNTDDDNNVVDNQDNDGNDNNDNDDNSHSNITNNSNNIKPKSCSLHVIYSSIIISIVVSTYMYVIQVS